MQINPKLLNKKIEIESEDIMGIFPTKSKGKNTNNEECNIILHLNMRLMPVDRGTFFEDPIDDILRKYDVGKVTGGGTSLSKERMPISCDIDFKIKRDKIDNFISFLKNSRAIAQGSYIYVEYNGEKKEIGILEGLSLILDGTGLSEDVYKENDVNDVISEINSLLKGKGQYYSYYIGEKETNLYFYGNSFDEMKEIIVNYTKTSPLCENSIIEKI